MNALVLVMVVNSLQVGLVRRTQRPQALNHWGFGENVFQMEMNGWNGSPKYSKLFVFRDFHEMKMSELSWWIEPRHS